MPALPGVADHPAVSLLRGPRDYRQPGVVSHPWQRLGAYEKKRAEMLARLGYNVLAVDIYGQGIRPDNPRDAAAEAGKFEDEMRPGGVDWQLIAYGGAVHSFTHWDAGGDISKGAAYNERADKRFWEAMKQFFAELFR